MFGFMGIVLLIAAAYLYRTSNQLAAEGEPALGTVVDFRKVRGARRQGAGRGSDASNFHWYDAPVIRFTAHDGQTILFSALSGGYPEGLKQGDEIDVVYLPSDPETAEVMGSTRLTEGAVVLVIFGSVSLIPGMVMFLTKRRRKR